MVYEVKYFLVVNKYQSRFSSFSLVKEKLVDQWNEGGLGGVEFAESGLEVMKQLSQNPCQEATLITLDLRLGEQEQRPAWARPRVSPDAVSGEQEPPLHYQTKSIFRTVLFVSLLLFIFNKIQILACFPFWRGCDNFPTCKDMHFLKQLSLPPNEGLFSIFFSLYAMNFTIFESCSYSIWNFFHSFVCRNPLFMRGNKQVRGIRKKMSPQKNQ